jgi:hypothetical protein
VIAIRKFATNILLFFVAICAAHLISSFIFRGKMEITMSEVQVSALAALLIAIGRLLLHGRAQ